MIDREPDYRTIACHHHHHKKINLSNTYIVEKPLLHQLLTIFEWLFLQVFADQGRGTTFLFSDVNKIQTKKRTK